MQYAREDLELATVVLEDAGLSRVGSSAEFSDDPDEAQYATLSEGAVALLSEPPEATLEEVAEKVGEDFAVMPDIELSIARPEDSGESDESAPPIGDVVPEASGVQAAHEAEKDGKGAVIALLDSGITRGHREFDGHGVEFGVAPKQGDIDTSMEAYDPGPKFHGTHVSGIATGSTVGVAPGADLIMLGVLEPGADYSTVASRVFNAISWLFDNIDREPYAEKPVILSMSLGFTAESVGDRDFAASVDAIRVLLQQALELEILCVAAIGNDPPPVVCAPAYFPESLSVGAVDYELNPWADSGGGTGPGDFEQRMNPDIAGFGVGVRSSMGRTSDGRSLYGPKNGTSMAAPYVAGVAALTALKTGLTGTELRDQLIAEAVKLDHDENRVGRGLASYHPEDG